MNHTAFDELYANLDWRWVNPSAIEDRLAERRKPKNRALPKGETTRDKPSVFLYNVTRSDLEGKHNALAAFGYNRDGQKGKRPILIGLPCNEKASGDVCRSRSRVEGCSNGWKPPGFVCRKHGPAAASL